MAEEYCWTITEAVEEQCCVLKFGFKLDSSLYVRTYILDHTYGHFRLAQTLVAPDILARNWSVKPESVFTSN